MYYTRHRLFAPSLPTPGIPRAPWQSRDRVANRPIDDDEIQDAVQELYGRILSSYVGVRSDGREGGGEDRPYRAWVFMWNRNEGAYRSLDREFEVPHPSDIQCAYEVASSEHGSDVDMSDGEES